VAKIMFFIVIAVTFQNGGISLMKFIVLQDVNVVFLRKKSPMKS
jgi:hypothetical protein